MKGRTGDGIDRVHAILASQSWYRRALLWFHIRREVRRLRPWYQPIRIAPGIETPAEDKAGRRIRSHSLDRGLAKWQRFIRPNLPVPLQDRRVLEIGCNAGLFLFQAIHEGAREAIGLEPDPHYRAQAEFLIEARSAWHRRIFPVWVFEGRFEDFDYELLGYFDLALLLNVIYHVGKASGRRILPPEVITQK